MSKTGRNTAGGGLEGSVTHLLQRAVRLALDFHAEAAGAGAVTQRQYTVLAAAGAADGQNQNDLVRATGIDRSTLAELVSRMLAKGLLERERCATDARANTVRLSPKGRTALAEGAGAAGAADERLLALLAPKKSAALLKILGGLAGGANRGGEAPAPAPRKAEKARKKKKKKNAAKAAKIQDIGA
ncbi:MAG TPA: MarR family winged helix-turn-helix transcriptional regulator [Caulobacteraceae bacterium]